MHELVNNCADVFTKPGKPVAFDIKHKIELLYPEKPIPHHRQQRIREIELKKVQKYLKEQIEIGWIYLSTSQYSHSILFVYKKTSKLRVYMDCRSLNSNTRIDRYPIAGLDNTLYRLGYAKIFTKIDLACGYR